MKIITSFFFILCIFLFISCSGKSDEYYFNGKISIVTENVPTIKIGGKEIIVNEDMPAFRMFAVYDSLIFVYYNKHPEAYQGVYNLKNSQLIGDFCQKGGGPKESYGVPPVSQFYVEKGMLKTILFAPNNKKLLVWNISESLNQKTSVYDTIIPYDWSKEHVAMYNYVFRLKNDTLLTLLPPITLDIEGTDATLPFLQKRTFFTNEKINDYTLYKNQIKNGNTSFAPDHYFSSFISLKPDNKKVALGMIHLSQLNILDLATG